MEGQKKFQGGGGEGGESKRHSVEEMSGAIGIIGAIIGISGGVVGFKPPQKNIHGGRRGLIVCYIQDQTLDLCHVIILYWSFTNIR